MTVVRTRIAPSPTGDPHVGTAYVALFNYCFARQHGGQFLLRIEDTDQVRSTRESEAAILRSLKWLGLTWDEGPDVGGPHGPYRQSERSAIYRAHADELIEKGHAFRCFCTPQRLDEVRKTQLAAQQTPGYDGHCAGLSATESAARAAAGETHVVRMKVPREGVCQIQDLLRGQIEIEWAQVDMQVLLKSDGLPTYHLANVVDDHLMGITHVLRGEEWISSAPKHLLLYGYFGWQAPQLCHLPLLRNPDKSKLSKRKNPTSIVYYERMGFLPEALLNYLGMMAWSMPDEREKFALEEMVAHFDLSRVSLGGPVFDQAKLSWLNGRWIRESLTPQQFGERVAQWALNADYLGRITPLVQGRVERLSDLGAMTSFFFQGLIEPNPAELTVKGLDADGVRRALQWVSWRVEDTTPFTRDTLEPALRETAELLGLKTKDFLRVLFVTFTGKPVSTPLFETMELLGRDLCRARLRHAQTLLGLMTSKEDKKWKAELEAAEKALAEKKLAAAAAEPAPTP
jgi:glutamyl-tRNA synthetase